MERDDRVADEPEQELVAQERVTMDLEISRQPEPEPSDGEVCIPSRNHDSSTDAA